MQIFGLDPVVATILLTGLGLVLQNVVAWLKSSEPFNIRNAAASGIIAYFLSSVAVANTIGAIPDGIDPIVLYTTLATAVASVAGFDILIKNGAKAITAKAVKH